MNRLGTLLVLASATLPGAAAGQTVSGPYVSLGGGVSFLQNQTIKGVSSPVGTLFSGSSIRTDTGPMGSAAVGYGLGNGVRVELQGDWRENRLASLGGVPAGGDQEQYGAFVNVLYDFDLKPFGIDGLSPYAGLGAGYEQSHFLNVGALSAAAMNGGLAYVRSTGTAGDFTAQGILGLAFTMHSLPGMALTAEYRFSAIPEDVSANGQFFDNAQGGRAHIRTDGTYNQAALLGIRFALFPPAQKLAPNHVVVPPAPAPPETVRTYLVFFDWDRADLSTRAREIVAQAAASSTHVQTTRIDVNGYTDRSGTAAYNQKLSQRRAESVAAELVRDGVARSEIFVGGFGEADPLVPTADGVREPQNRRVEIILH